MRTDNIIEGKYKIPLRAFSGSAVECGRQYAVATLRDFPDYTIYLQKAWTEWNDPELWVVNLFKKRAPYIFDIYRGICDVLKKNNFSARTVETVNENCTSFAASPEGPGCGNFISGQNKDTDVESLKHYTVLRMRLNDGPTILVLAYPGEILGYGMWSNGNTLFRNDLKSSSGGNEGLSMVQFGLLALASGSVTEMVDLAGIYGIKGAGNLLLSDRNGDSVSIEFNAGGINFIYPEQGILTHANHPVGGDTAAFEDYPDQIEKENSRYRHEKLRELLYINREELDRDKAFACLADHSRYPRGICRHKIGNNEKECTTTAIVAEPARGCLSLTKGPPCSNDYETYFV